ncbi:MerR family transcriptional regulator [Nocardia sp. NPDC050718]|uniref:MerR family transcriptional regulator n=1 Tax=Nocardia sp. NPDC050718 TaxID=3155788 RepID=UPI00340146B8
MTDDTGLLIGIGELARATGFPVRTIRFYCDEGILDARRSAGGHRLFEADGATERLLLIRRLRAFGLGLESITGVLRGERSIDEAVAAESARVEGEFRSVAWRRASLRAVGAADPAQRADRLALLAAAQDGGALHDDLVRFWRRILAPIDRHEVDRYVGWNVPEPPADPTVDEVVAYAELAALVADRTMSGAVRQHLWWHEPDLIHDPQGLYADVAEALTDVVARVADDVRPRRGSELDRFVEAHADARGLRDSPAFREQLLSDTPDHRIDHYWTLTAQLVGDRITVGRAIDWVRGALIDSAGAATC